MNRPDILACALDARDPYTNDRDYPQPEEWADGANPFARPHPDLPWVDRGLPIESWAYGAVGAHPVEFHGHEGHTNDFPHPAVIAGPKRVAVDRPERVA